MTVASGARSSTAGNGTTTAFSATFRAKAASGVSVVLVDTSDGAVTAQVQDTDYTVELDEGGLPTVTFVTAPVSGNNVLIYPTPTYNQPNTFTPGGPIFGDSVEENFDAVLTLIQGLQDQIDQCFRFAQGNTAIAIEPLLQSYKDKYLFFNATTGQPEPKDLAVVQTELGMLGADLSTIEALTPTNNDILQRKADSWINRTLAQLWVDLKDILPDSLRFSGDPDTGLTRSGANTLQVTVGGSAAAQFDANGQTLPLQPAFSAYLSADASNVTGNGTAYSLVCDTEIYDRNSDYATGTGVFTAPVTGLYDFSGAVRLLAAGSATTVLVELVTTNRTYIVAEFAGGAVDISTNLTVPWAVNGADMDAGETAFVRVTVTGEGGDTTDIDGGSAPLTWFSGRLAA